MLVKDNLNVDSNEQLQLHDDQGKIKVDVLATNTTDLLVKKVSLSNLTKDISKLNN